MEKAIDQENPDKVIQAVETELASETINAKAKDLIDLQKKSSLASKLDIQAARNLRDSSDERRLQPLFIQRFFQEAYKTAGGNIRKDENYPVYSLGLIPECILSLARDIHKGIPVKYETPFVFDKELLSVASPIRIPDNTKLLGPGHPLFEVLIDWTIRNSRESFAKGVKLIDPSITQPQHIWLVSSSIEDGRHETKKRLAHEQLSLVVEDSLGLRQTSPSYLLRCISPEGEMELPELPNHGKEDIETWSYSNITEKQLQTVKTARIEECDLRKSYLETAFTDLILELQEELNNLQQAQLFGKDDVELRHKLEKRVRELNNRKKLRLEELELMLKLTANLPNIWTEAMILPSPVAVLEGNQKRGFPMRRDDEVEAIAMDITMKYEHSRGWTPIDVSADGEHYDIRSESTKGDKRFIEVKGRAQSGVVVLTGPELDKLKQLKERAWLYIVTFCKSEKPHLRIINNPGSCLTPEMLYRQVQWMVDENDWITKGDEIIIDIMRDGATV